MLCIGMIGNLDACGRPVPPGNVNDNIALGTTYTMSPAPNSTGCSDSPGDTTQLTGGYNYTGTGSLWAQMSTVGWQYQRPTITIDLGVVQPIKGVYFCTAARSRAGADFDVTVDSIKIFDKND